MKEYKNPHANAYYEKSIKCFENYLRNTADLYITLKKYIII